MKVKNKLIAILILVAAVAASSFAYKFYTSHKETIIEQPKDHLMIKKEEIVEPIFSVQEEQKSIISKHTCDNDQHIQLIKKIMNVKNKLKTSSDVADDLRSLGIDSDLKILSDLEIIELSQNKGFYLYKFRKITSSDINTSFSGILVSMLEKFNSNEQLIQAIKARLILDDVLNKKIEEAIHAN